MIEEIKQLLSMVEKMPEMVLHVLLGFGVYKLIVFLGTSAGIYGTIRLAINKLYDWKTLEHTKPREVVLKIGDHFVLDSSRDEFIDLLQDMKSKSYAGDSYRIYSTDIEFLRDAIREKKEREAKK